MIIEIREGECERNEEDGEIEMRGKRVRRKDVILGIGNEVLGKKERKRVDKDKREKRLKKRKKIEGGWMKMIK